jgi:predicted ATPase
MTLNKFPVYTTTFVGRDRAESELKALLANPDLRLLTLVGASGSGKTRLSLQVAAALSEQFPDGCVFLALAPVTEPGLVLSTIAHQLEISEHGAESVLAALVSGIAGRRMLLILDNVEQVVAAAPDLQALIQQTSHLRLLLTSQVALELPEETTYLVPALALPAEVPADIAALQAYSAVTLFVDRMRQSQPQFAVTPENSAAVVEICQLVEGLPLAIELIAAHSASLTPADLLLLLRRHLTIGKLRLGTNSRQRVIRPILDWCVSRLEPAEQQLFFRLGIFVGGWTLESATLVCNHADDLSVDIVDGIELLSAKHLIQDETLWGQEQRYIMLDTVHEYTNQRLRSLRQLPALAEAHASYFAELVATASAVPPGDEQVAWLQRFDSEYHNIRAALHWAHRHHEPEALGRFTQQMAFFWNMRGYLYEGRDWIQRALAGEERLPLELAALLCYELGSIELDLLNFTESAAAYNHGLELARHSDDLRLQARMLNGLGRLAGVRGQMAEAIDCFSRNLEVYRALEDQPGIARTLSNLAYSWVTQGAYADALPAYEESLAISRAGGNLLSASVTLTNIGQLHWLRGDFAQSAAVTSEALGMAETLGDSYGIALTRLNLGDCAAREGDLATALAHTEEGLRIAREAGLHGVIIQGLTSLATVRLALGQPEQSRRAIDEAYQNARDHGLESALPEIVEHYARLAIQAGRWEPAARLLGQVVALRSASEEVVGPTPTNDHRLLAEATQAHLSAEQWAALAAEGAAADLDTLLAALA